MATQVGVEVFTGENVDWVDNSSDIDYMIVDENNNFTYEMLEKSMKENNFDKILFSENIIQEDEKDGLWDY